MHVLGAGRRINTMVQRNAPLYNWTDRTFHAGPFMHGRELRPETDLYLYPLQGSHYLHERPSMVTNAHQDVGSLYEKIYLNRSTMKETPMIDE